MGRQQIHLQNTTPGATDFNVKVIVREKQRETLGLEAPTYEPGHYDLTRPLRNGSVPNVMLAVFYTRTGVFDQQIVNLLVSVLAVQPGPDLVRADVADEQTEIGHLFYSRDPGVDDGGHRVAQTADQIAVRWVDRSQRIIGVRQRLYPYGPGCGRGVQPDRLVHGGGHVLKCVHAVLDYAQAGPYQSLQ